MRQWVSVLKHGVDHGTDFVACDLTPDRKLTGCQSSSPAAAMLMEDLKASFVPNDAAVDGARVRGSIAIILDWSQLWQAAQAMKPTSTTAQ
jgi:hypothetical protein